MLTDPYRSLLNQYMSTGGNSFSYDNNFNLTHTAGFNGVYDAANRLVLASNGGSGEAQTTIVGFVYDGLGRCVKRTVGSAATVFIYDGWKPIGEWEESTPAYFHAWNVYGPGADEILLRQQGNIGYIRFQLDRHGNVAFLLDNDANLVEKYTYDVFGQPKITDATGNVVRAFSYYHHAFHFQGREYIRQLGIYDYRNRLYSPTLGRFIQTDPIGLQTEGAKLSAQQAALYAGEGAPETFGSSELNLYRYCNNDPVNGSDPFGLDHYKEPGFTKDFSELGKGFDQAPAVIKATFAIQGALLTLPAGGLAAFSARAAVVARLAVPAAAAAAHANRLNHIFGKAEHQLSGLVRTHGSQNAAFNAVQKAANEALVSGKLTPNAHGILPTGDAGNIVKVGDTTIRLIGGRVLDGKVQISDFSRKGLK